MSNKNYDLKSAQEASAKGQILEWTIEFLRASGNPNQGLANKLEREGHYHFGPTEYSLERLQNIIGSNNSFKYVEEEKKLTARVEKMYRDIKQGWQPPPIIAADFWEPFLEISDGGHRQRALLKAGIKKYSTIFFFKSKQSMDAFLKEEF